MKAKRGQVAIYLLTALVVLCLITLMNVDVFVAVRGKNHVQNAGDAAAIAAARRQGTLLNEIARLNFEHIRAAADDDAERCEEIVLDQRRLALLGPVEGLRDASEAAKRNGMEVREEFSQILREHVEDIRSVYSGGTGEDGDPYPEPWPGAWGEYAAAIESAISGGLAAGPDNVEFYDAQGGHLLLNRSFYHAIAGRNWCWFHFNCEEVLKSYRDYHEWGPLPGRKESSMENGEIFSLHVKAWKGALTDVFEMERIVDLYETYGDGGLSLEELQASSVITNRDQVWFFLDPDVWRSWYEISPWGEGGDYAFPVVGEVRREYDVRGCASICRCVLNVPSEALENETDLTWAAAAKPFGKVEVEGEPAPAQALSGFLVPCFSDVRLVPLDAVGGEDLATADIGWVDHVRHHLPEYLLTGPRANGCFYCQQLETWEHESFRRSGVNWLKYNSGTCVRGTGGPGGHGGTSHGH